MSRKNARKRDRGLGLLEVVIAFAILGVALATLLDGAAVGARGSGKARDATWALLTAESLLAEVGAVIPLEAGLERGTLADGARFERRIVLLGRKHEATVNAYEVTVSVTPKNGAPVRLVTLRLAPHAQGR